MSITEEQLQKFLSCGQPAQDAVDEVIANHNKQIAIEKACEKAKRTGSLKDLQEFLRLRREML